MFQYSLVIYGRVLHGVTVLLIKLDFRYLLFVHTLFERRKRDKRIFVMYLNISVSTEGERWSFLFQISDFC